MQASPQSSFRTFASPQKAPLCPFTVTLCPRPRPRATTNGLSAWRFAFSSSHFFLEIWLKGLFLEALPEFSRENWLLPQGWSSGLVLVSPQGGPLLGAAPESFWPPALPWRRAGRPTGTQGPVSVLGEVASLTFLLSAAQLEFSRGVEFKIQGR